MSVPLDLLCDSCGNERSFDSDAFVSANDASSDLPPPHLCPCLIEQWRVKSLRKEDQVAMCPFVRHHDPVFLCCMQSKRHLKIMHFRRSASLLGKKHSTLHSKTDFNTSRNEIVIKISSNMQTCIENYRYSHENFNYELAFKSYNNEYLYTAS